MKKELKDEMRFIVRKKEREKMMNWQKDEEVEQEQLTISFSFQSNLVYQLIIIINYEQRLNDHHCKLQTQKGGNNICYV